MCGELGRVLFLWFWYFGHNILVGDGWGICALDSSMSAAARLAYLQIDYPGTEPYWWGDEPHIDIFALRSAVTFMPTGSILVTDLAGATHLIPKRDIGYTRVDEWSVENARLCLAED